MPELIQAYWPYLLAALLIGLAVAWFVFVANRKTSVTEKDAKDVLDDGAAPAERNKALIDAPKAAVSDTGVAVSETKVEPVQAPEPAPRPTPEPIAPLIEADPVPPVLGEAPEEAVGEADIPASAPHPAPSPAPPAAPAPATNPAADDLTQIKGLGPKLAGLLNTLGVTSFAQIAGWDDAEIDRVDAQLDRFAGRIRRDNWIEQAKLLAAGDETGFSDKFGQNG